MMVMVDCNAGVAVLPRRLAARLPDSIRYCSIERTGADAPKCEIKILAAWRDPHHNTCIDTVLHTLEQVLPAEDANSADSQFA